MTKDVKGLLIYLFIMLIIWVLPAAAFYCGFGALYYDDNAFLSYLNLILAVVLFLLYFILPVILTYKAMRHHWSKYLDKFFFHKLWPTVVFLFFIFLHLTEHIFHYSVGSSNLIPGIIFLLFFIIETFIAPAYYLPYIILLIMKKCKLL